jgi:hypothetical protein
VAVVTAPPLASLTIPRKLPKNDCAIIPPLARASRHTYRVNVVECIMFENFPGF